MTRWLRPLPRGSSAAPPGTDERSAASASTAAQLFQAHNAELVRFLLFKLRNEAEAREVAQEAYVRLLQLRDTGAVGFLRAYLFRIAANLAVDRLRDQRPVTEGWEGAGAELVPDSFDMERSVLAAEEYALLLRCLDELPPRCREVFTLHRMERLSTQQVAAQLGISTRMVRKHISRALMYCRYRLDGLAPAAALEKLSHD